MAVKAVYQAILNSQSNDIYRIQLIDTDYEGDVTDNALYGYGSSNLPRTIDVIHESVSISWEGEDNKLAQPIIGSKLDISFLLSDDTMNLIDVIKELPEHHLCIQVERHNGATTSLDTDSNWDVYWRGPVVHESVVYAFSCEPLEISMSFTDGLALLKDEPYLDPSDQSNYLSDGLDAALTNSSFAPLRVQIGRCLKRMPHLAMWGDTDDFFTEQLDLFHWNHIDETEDPDEIKSILDKTGCDQRTWYAERSHDGPWFRDSRLVANGSTCYEILSDIMVTMGATLHHSAGKFNVASPFMQESDSVINGRRKFLMDKRGTIDSSYAYSPYTQPSGYADGTDWPNYVDYTDEADTPYLIESSRSYLPPAKRCVVSHLSGGSPLIFKQTSSKVGYVGGVTGAAGGSVTPDPVEDNLEINYAYNFPLINSQTTVESGQQLNLRAKITIGADIIATSPNGLVDTLDAEYVGAQPVLKMKIKVGNQYLKQNVGLRASSNFTNDTDFGHVRIGLGNVSFPAGNDITTWLPLEITDDVQWTTTSSFFYLPFLIPGQMEGDLDVIEYEDGNGNVEEYAVGLNTERDDNHPNQMRFRNELRANEQKTLMLDMVMPGLPTDSSTYTGVELDMECIIYNNDGTTYTLTTDDNDDFHSCRVYDLQLMNGEDAYDEDAMYYASLDDANGTETIDVGETAIGTRPDTMYGELGALAVGDGHRTTGRASVFGDHWFSESMQSFPTSDDGSKNLDLVVQSHFSQRYKVVDTYRMTVLTRRHLLEHVVPTRRVKITMGTQDAIVQVQACSINLQEGSMQFSAYEVDRTYTSITTDNSFDQFAQDLGRKGPARILGETVLGKNRLVGSGAGLTPVQEDKLDAITINGSGEITGLNATGLYVLDADNINDTYAIHKFASSAQLDQIAANESALTDIQTVFKETTSGDGIGVYVNTSATDESHVSVTSTTGKLQAGSNTKVEMSEQSPGDVQLKVQAGATGSETSVTGIQVFGSSTANKANVAITGGGDLRIYNPTNFFPSANVTFNGSTSGIDYNDLDNLPQGAPQAVNYCRMSMSSAVLKDGASQQDFTGTTDVTVKFDTEDDNDGGELTTNTTTHRVTVGSDGLYRLTANMSFYSTAQRATPAVRFNVNGTNIVGESMGYIRAASGNNEATANVSRVIYLNSNDYIEVCCHDESTVTGAIYAEEAIFEVEKLGGVIGPAGADGTDGVDGTNGSDGAPGADGVDGADGLGFTGGSYDSGTGVVTFTSDDGLGFSTGDLRGADGADGVDGTNGTNGTDGADGLGFTGGSYDSGTGVVTFTSDDGLGFSTGDLRGADGADGADAPSNFADLDDVDPTLSPAPGDLLLWTTQNGGQWDSTTPALAVGGQIDINDLGNVSDTTGTAGNILVDYNVNGPYWISVPASTWAGTYLALQHLANVTGTPSSGDLLKYNGTNWEPYTPPAAVSYFTIQSSFYTGDGNGDYIPIGGTLTETTSAQYYNRWTAPMSGEVVSARVFVTSTTAGSSTIAISKYPIPTTIDSYTQTISSANTDVEFTFDTATFVAGDQLRFWFDPTGSPAGVSITILIKLEHP